MLRRKTLFILFVLLGLVPVPLLAQGWGIGGSSSGGGGGGSGDLLSTNNLSDVTSAATSRINLGLVAIASSGSAADISAGILPVARLPVPLSLQSAASTVPPVLLLTKGLTSESALDMREPDNWGYFMRWYLPADTDAKPVGYIGNGGNIATRASLTVSGSQPTSLLEPGHAEAAMVNIWADTVEGIVIRPSTDANTHALSVLNDAGTVFLTAIDKLGTIKMGRGSTRFSHDVGLSSAVAGQMEINSGVIGTLRDLKLRNLVSTVTGSTTNTASNALNNTTTGNITVDSTTGWPATGTLRASEYNTVEYMSFSVVDGTTLNITARGTYGTTAAAKTGVIPLTFATHITSASTSTLPMSVFWSDGAQQTRTTGGSYGYAVSLYPGTNSTTGFGFDLGLPSIYVNSVLALQVGTGEIYIDSNYHFKFGFDTYLRRRSAANLLFGEADAAAPVAQTLSVQSVVAGTSNVAGALWTLNGSISTGSGLGGALRAQHSDSVAAATAQNALAETWRSDFVGLKVASGKHLWVGNAYVATPQVSTGYLVIYDSTGTAYKVSVTQ